MVERAKTATPRNAEWSGVLIIVIFCPDLKHPLVEEALGT